MIMEPTFQDGDDGPDGHRRIKWDRGKDLFKVAEECFSGARGAAHIYCACGAFFRVLRGRSEYRITATNILVFSTYRIQKMPFGTDTQSYG